MRWHPFTAATLEHHGFAQDFDAAPNGDMLRGNWRIRPACDHIEHADQVEQFPLTLEHTARGVCLVFYEATMLDLLQMLG